MKKILSLCVVMVAIFFTTNISALELATAGETIVQEGNYDSIRFVAGKKVTNKANIDGLSFIAGEELELEGSTPYGFYGGKIINISEKVEKDLFVAGEEINIKSDAKLGRDVYITGSTLKIDTNVTRDLRASSSKIDISGITIGGDAYIKSSEIIMDENTVINGKLLYPEEADVTGLSKAKIGKVETYKTATPDAEETLIDQIINFVVSCLAGFVTLVVLFYIVPKFKEKLDEEELKAKDVIKRFLIGIAFLIVVPIVAIMAVFTSILTPVALITLALYAIILYLSSLVVSYLAGKLMTEKLMQKDNMYLAILCGVVALKIVKLIPIIGGLVSVVVFFYGIGLITKYIKER